MSRAARLLELLVRVQTKPRFTAAELAEEFEVSKRTMMRDLTTLSQMGVPLRSTSGPGGGFSLPRGGRKLSPQLTVDEGIALILSYESFLRYAESPFSSESLSVVTKLRAALPPDVVGELDRLREHVAVFDPVRHYEAPLLRELLEAALDEAHLEVVYDSKSGVSERVIFPFGIFASQGFWYCACHDYRRGHSLTMRADRFRSVERVEGYEIPPHPPLSEWNISHSERNVGEIVEMRAWVSERGMKDFRIEALIGDARATPDGNGVIIEAGIPLSHLDFYATDLLGASTEVKVHSPPELVEAIKQKAKEVADIYE